MDREEVTSHAALDIVNTPNPFFTRYALMEAFQQHLDLMGEACWVVSKMGKLPIELWPVRPDRIEPVPHPTKFISGYVYTSPDGEKIPLNVDDVIRCTLPNPEDFYHGLGPVQSVLVKLDIARYSAEWNRNFFISGANPGGIIHVERKLSDREFREMKTRWDEQHRGVARAHRIHILEQGSYEPVKFSAKDMQFAEMDGLTREHVREAFRFPKPMLGSVDDVNRANAEAAEVIFSRWTLLPRLNRIRDALNAQLLRLYGASAKGLEFDYQDPTPADKAACDASMVARVGAAKTIIDLGFDASDVFEKLELPDFEEAEEEPEPEPVLVPVPGSLVPPGAEDPTEEEEPEEDPTGGAGNGPPSARTGKHPRILAKLDEGAPDVDLSGLQKIWEIALDKLVSTWDKVWTAQNEALLSQIKTAVEREDYLAIADIAAPEGMGADILEEAMLSMYKKSAVAASAEADASGIELAAAKANEELMRARATATSRLLARELSLSAARKALQINTPEATGQQVIDAVQDHLESLTHASTKKQLGGALTDAQNKGRIDTFGKGPVDAFYGDEQLDENTCSACRKVNGKWLGNTADEAQLLYPNGGYRDCKGGANCRGTVVVTWRGGDDQTFWKEKEGVDVEEEYEKETKKKQETRNP
jgi:HK97 family phage portal protein